MPMIASRKVSARSWFRGRGGRRFGMEFGLIIGVKLILLIALWALVIRPMPRADTSPAALERHFSTEQSRESTQ